MAPTAPYTHVVLDRLPGRRNPEALGETVWKPLRATLDVTAFGTNAYVAPVAGTTVIEEHDEAGDPGQEEMYVVLRGRARFTIGPESFEVGAGELVFVRDPGARRHATALEAGTSVLAVGAPAGSQAPSEWEARWLAELPAEGA